jgi:hypothetical protein
MALFPEVPMLLKQNTAQTISFEEHIVDGYKFMKEGSNVVHTGIGTIAGPFLGSVWRITLDHTETDTLGDFYLMPTWTGDPGVPQGPTDHQVVPDWPGGSVSSVTGNIGGNVNGHLGGDVLGTVIGNVNAILTAAQPHYAPALAGDAMALTPGERNAVAAALLNFANGADVGITPGQALMILCSVLGGKLNTAGGTAHFRNPADTKDRLIVATAPGGNRIAIAYDFS